MISFLDQLAQEFSLRELQNLYEAILGVRMDRSGANDDPYPAGR